MDIPVLVNMLTLAVRGNDNELVKKIQQELENNPEKEIVVRVNLFTTKRKNRIRVISAFHKVCDAGLKQLANWVDPTITTKVGLNGIEIEKDTELTLFDFETKESNVYKLFSRLKDLDSEFTFEFGSATLSNFLK